MFIEYKAADTFGWQKVFLYRLLAVCSASVIQIVMLNTLIAIMMSRR